MTASSAITLASGPSGHPSILISVINDKENSLVSVPIHFQQLLIYCIRIRRSSKF